MKILVIGNGFDLAHNLPTSYKDFLDFCKATRRVENKITEERLTELSGYIKDNTWLEYFEIRVLSIGENWIDFESEIARVIRVLDDVRRVLENGGNILELQEEKSLIIKDVLRASKKNVYTTFNSVEMMDLFSHFLYGELEKLIRALEIYIAKYVNQAVLEKQSPDIVDLNPEHVLSFNYSATYERLYGERKEIEYDYIHGKADIYNSIETNNMVLGIDEYLSDEEKNLRTQLIVFKKYYQRLYKQSMRLSEIWCAEIRKEAEYQKNSRRFMLEKQIEFDLISNESEYNRQGFERLARTYDAQYDEMNPKHEVYIFGHSLDVTDKDILCNLILNDNVHTTIFYCKKQDKNGKLDNGRKDYGQKLKNLVGVIGQEELIKRTGNGTIEFRLQQDMVPITRNEGRGKMYYD